jgi:hypothetical protein
MALLALSSITNYTGSLRLSDTLVHFICFCIATGVFYFIIDVEEYVVSWFPCHVIIHITDLYSAHTEMLVEFGFGAIQA